MLFFDEQAQKKLDFETKINVNVNFHTKMFCLQNCSEANSKNFIMNLMYLSLKMKKIPAQTISSLDEMREKVCQLRLMRENLLAGEIGFS